MSAFSIHMWQFFLCVLSIFVSVVLILQIIKIQKLRLKLIDLGNKYVQDAGVNGAELKALTSTLGFYKSGYEEYRDNEKVLKDELNMYRDRAKSIEDAIKNERGVPIRNEVIKLDVPFNKLDFVILYSGVCKLLKDSGVLVDSEAYIRILKSLQEIIDKLPEPTEEKDGKPAV